jgi:glycogen(starch) synthase
MKIWILSSEFPPQAGGGIGTYAHHAAAMFSSAGHQVTVLTPATGAGEPSEANNLRIVRFAPRHGHADDYLPPGTPPEQHPGFPFNCLSYWPALSYQFADEVCCAIERNGRPDVIEVQDYNAVGYYLIQRKLLRDPLLKDCPILVHTHSPQFGVRAANQSPQYVLPEYWIGQMEKFCLLGADALLSPSSFIRDWLSASDHRFPTSAVIPLPYEHGQPSNSEPTPGDVVYVGRLEVRKGVIPLVAACARLWDQGHDFRLTLVGEDRQYDPLGTSVGGHLKQRFAGQIEAGHLCLAGALWRDDLLGRIAGAWCTVVPSLWENYPYTCIEAMSLGKVVLASSSGGQAEMVGDDGSAGVLFDWSREGDLERALIEVLAMTPAQNRAMGKRGVQRIRQLTSYEAVLPPRVAHLQKVVGQSSRSRQMFPSVSPSQPSPVQTVQSEHSVADLLSVVIPYHNLGEYIEETLESVLNSSYPHIEVLIVNDGSDETESIAALERIEGRPDGRVRVLHTENQGVCAARNTGAEEACGQFLCLLDADDLVEPEVFSRCIEILDAYENVGFVYPWVSYFGQVSGCWASWNTDFPFFLAHNVVPPMAVTRRDLFLAFGRNRADMELNLEDYDSWLGIAARGYLGVGIPEVLGRYRVRAESRLRGIHRDQSLYLYERIVQHHAATYRRYSTELFHLLNANGPARGLESPASIPEAVLVEFALENVRRSGLWRFSRRLAASRLGRRVVGWLHRGARAFAAGRHC